MTIRRDEKQKKDGEIWKNREGSGRRWRGGGPIVIREALVGPDAVTSRAVLLDPLEDLVRRMSEVKVVHSYKAVGECPLHRPREERE